MIELFRAQADKGNFSHLSVYAQWGAHNSPTVFHASFVTPYGQGHADNTDPVAAIQEAIEKAPKEKQRYTPVQSSIAPSDHIGGESGHARTALAPAPVVGQPSNAPKGHCNTRIKPRQGQGLSLPNGGQGLSLPNGGQGLSLPNGGQGSVSTPNLMDLFK